METPIPNPLAPPAADPLARVQWLGWTSFGAMLLTNGHAASQWLQMINAGGFEQRLGGVPFSAWFSLGLHAVLFIFGLLWLVFVLTRSWPRPRPPLGSPFVALSVQSLAICVNSLLATLFRGFGG